MVILDSCKLSLMLIFTSYLFKATFGVAWYVSWVVFLPTWTTSGSTWALGVSIKLMSYTRLMSFTPASCALGLPYLFCFGCLLMLNVLRLFSGLPSWQLCRWTGRLFLRKVLWQWLHWSITFASSLWSQAAESASCSSLGKSIALGASFGSVISILSILFSSVGLPRC